MSDPWPNIDDYTNDWLQPELLIVKIGLDGYRSKVENNSRKRVRDLEKKLPGFNRSRHKVQEFDLFLI
jgi:hypothetical protein